MKGVIPTPDIAKIFHPTPDIEGKKCPVAVHLGVKMAYYTKSTLDIVFFKSTSGAVKYLISTLDTDPPPFKGPNNSVLLRHHIFGRNIYYNLCMS